jgi:putative peptide zinc metalloprotease protein
VSSPFLSASWFKVASLKPSLRAHARIQRHRYRGTIWYVVDDRAAGRSHRFQPWRLSAGRAAERERTVDAIWQELVAQLGEEAPTQDEVIGALSELHRADLLASACRRTRTSWSSGTASRSGSSGCRT